MSPSSTPRNEAFIRPVRQRDGRGIITGDINLDAEGGHWTGFQAVHIFLLALEYILKAHGYSQFIFPSPSPAGLNSPKNGILV
ncbi:hypothetical protein BDFG_07845 [Blastomyces dermatitidis ATCC 26199]|nr:hypothetical protein BDFG_07845 [Blastomyces dermatitidis ATCC 26199]